MSELCELITYSFKVLVVICLFWLLIWGIWGGVHWWNKKENDDGFWDDWKKIMMISVIVFVVLLSISGLVPVTICRPANPLELSY